jgi:hypothetical protein
MNVEGLARALRDEYARAPKGDKAVTIHLFGIRHARELEGQNLHKLAERAGLSDSYGTELRKGVRLAEYVTLK